MEFLQPAVILAIAGIIGAGIAGNLFRVAATAMLPKVLSGALGGIALGSLLTGVLAGLPTGLLGAVPAIDPAAAGDAAAASFQTAMLVVQIGGGLLGGALLTGLVGAVLLKR